MSDENQIALEPESPSWWELVFVVLFLILLTGAFMNLFMTPDRQMDPAEGLPWMQWIWAAIYAGVVFLWHRHCRGSIGLLGQERTIVALTSLAIASAVWSDSPATTLRRSVALVGTLMMALYFASRFKIKEQLQILAAMFGACAAFSYLFGAMHWGRAIDDMEGAWYGIYTQRNSLGTMMVFGVLVFLLWSCVQKPWRWAGWGFAALSFGLVLLSGSMTSLVVFFVVLLLFPMVRLIRRYERTGRFLILLAVALMALGWWVGTSLDTVTEAMGRDSSLTGRTELWGASMLFGFDRPLLGYGYNAFWLGLEGRSEEIWQIVGWAAPNAHNGLLEIWLDLGIVGVAIVIVSFSKCLRAAFRLVHETARWEYAWPLLFLVILFVMNLTETAFFQGNSIYWFLYVVVAMDLTLLRQRLATNPTAVGSGAEE